MWEKNSLALVVRRKMSATATTRPLAPKQNESALPVLKKVPLGKWEREEIEDDIEGNGSNNLEGKQQNNGFFHPAAIQTR